MGLPPAPSVTDFDIVVPVIVAISLIISVTRLGLRARKGMLGWDDAFCAISACNMILLLASNFLFMQPPESIGHTTAIAMYYVTIACFNIVVWMARVSLVCTAVRIAAFQDHKRRLSILALVFILVCAILVAQEFWICERDPSWKAQSPPQCEMGQQRTITELCLDISADAALLMVSLHLLSKASALERITRIRLVLLFSTSILITVVSVVQDVLMLVEPGMREAFASMLEAPFALIVCSIPVVGAALFRVLDRRVSRAGLATSESSAAPSDNMGRQDAELSGSTLGQPHRKHAVLRVRPEGDFLQHELTLQSPSSYSSSYTQKSIAETEAHSVSLPPVPDVKEPA